MKKSVLWFCLAALFAFCTPTVACAGEKFVVGISTPTADHGWTGGIVWWVGQAIEEFGKKHPNVEFVYRTSASDKDQAADVDFFLEQKINALVILPHKPAPLITLLNKVNKAGVYIVVLDRSIPRVPKDVYLAGDNYGFGFKTGEFFAAKLQKGNILVMEGIPCEGNTMRVNGFKEGIKTRPEIVVLDSQPAYWDPAKGYELMQRYLQEFPQVDAIWCGDDDVMEGALRAYAESGRTDIQFFMGDGGSKQVVKRILDGDPLVPATVTYPPKMAYEAIRVAVERLAEGKEFPKEITIPSELVTKENAREHYYPDSIY